MQLLITENPLPPNLAFPESLQFRFFPTYVRDLPFKQSAEGQVRDGTELRLEVVMMLEGDLAADQYWTERVSMLPE